MNWLIGWAFSACSRRVLRRTLPLSSCLSAVNHLKLEYLVQKYY
jgi:hypothetical protein